MPLSFGKRARTRDKFSKAFKTKGLPGLARFLATYKLGDLAVVVARRSGLPSTVTRSTNFSQSISATATPMRQRRKHPSRALGNRSARSNAIDGLQAASGVLSAEVGKLDADMAANVQARSEAQAARDKANAAFLAMEADSEAAIEQMKNAIDTLSAVGADQTLADSAADHKQFMSGYKGDSLVKLRSVVKQALLAASSVTSGVKIAVVTWFPRSEEHTSELQSP